MERKINITKNTSSDVRNYEQSVDQISSQSNHSVPSKRRGNTKLSKGLSSVRIVIGL